MESGGGQLLWLQYILSGGLHLVFQALAVGLSLFLLVFEVCWLVTRDGAWLALWHFWARVFATIFGVALLTGLLFVWQEGLSLGRLAAIAGDVTAPPVALAALTALVLQTTVLAAMLRGQGRMAEAPHLLATALVAAGCLAVLALSVAAVSWPRSPVGQAVIDSRITVADWREILFVPGFWPRLVQDLAGAVLLAGLVVLAFAARWLRRSEHLATARQGLVAGMAALVISAPVLAGGLFAAAGHPGTQALAGFVLALLLLAAWGGACLYRGEAFSSRHFLAACIAAGVLAPVALLAGWLAPVVARAPWMIQDLLRTGAATTAVSDGSAATGLVVFAVIACLILSSLAGQLGRHLRAGPATPGGVPRGPGKGGSRA